MATVTTEVNSLAEVDEAMTRLSARKEEWALMPLSEKIEILTEVRGRVLNTLKSLGQARAKVVGLEDDWQYKGQVLLVQAVVISNFVDPLLKSLQEFVNLGQFPQGTNWRTSPTGEEIVSVDALTPSFLKEYRVDNYIQAGMGREQGGFYRRRGSSSSSAAENVGRVCVVLGAGNQIFLSVVDALSRLFVDGEVVWFKHHPLLASCAFYQDQMLEPLSRRGFYHGAANVDLHQTKHALHHPLVGAMHMTGGVETHDLLVWGAGAEERNTRKAKNDPLLKVPVTSELGCVTPWLVVPSPDWTPQELSHHAKQLAAGFADNNSCNCLAPKVVVLAKEWEHTETFVKLFKEEMERFPLFPPYYPGINSRYQDFKTHYPKATSFPSGDNPSASKHPTFGDYLPWLVNEMELDLSCAADGRYQNEYCFKKEPFAPVITLVRASFGGEGCLASANDNQNLSKNEGQLERTYLKHVPAFCNKNLFGTLSCTILVHPAAESNPGVSEAVEGAFHALEYGCITKNEFSGVGYMLPGAHWGGFQSSDLSIHDVGSGIGSIGNLHLFENVQKSVVHSPFISTKHIQPPHDKKLPYWLCQVLSGLLSGGLSGLVKMLFWW